MRILIVIAAYLAACLIASLVVVPILALEIPRLNVGATLLTAPIFGTARIALPAALPAVFVIAFAEYRAHRSPLFYGAAGIVCALVSGILFLAPDISDNREIGFFALKTLLPGLAAGLVYWAIAGRNAGKGTST